MSTLKTTNLQHASAASPAIVLDANSRATLNGLSYPTEGSLSGRSRIINGSMMIDQRNAGASVAITTAGNYTVDRWSGNATQNSKYTVQQNAGSVTPPAGFINYLGAVSSSAYSVTASDVFWLAQAVEGFNVSDLGWGTANAKSVTLSFWVRSSLTGTFGGALRNSDGTRSYPFSYTISAANTWEQKTITIAGDTSGTWLTTNGIGINLNFGLGVGSTFSGTAGAWAGANYVSATGATSVVGTNGATFYITGVQLEAGSVATPFERRSYGQELALCQRYYEKSYNVDVAPGTNTLTGAYQNTAVNSATTEIDSNGVFFKVTKRATPTVSTWTSAGTSGKWEVAGLGNLTPTLYTQGMSGFALYTTTTGLTQFQARYSVFHWVAEIEL